MCSLSRTAVDFLPVHFVKENLQRMDWYSILCRPTIRVHLVKCVQGAIFDVIIDVRVGSPTFLQWFGAELTAQNKRMMYVPAGFAHGFQSLTDYSEMTYMVSAFYNKEKECGIKYDDTAVGIEWPLQVSLVSDKDQAIPLIDASFTGVSL